MSAPVPLSVMGAGLIGKRHIEHVLARPEAILSSIVDPTPVARELAVSTLEHDPVRSRSLDDRREGRSRISPLGVQRSTTLLGNLRPRGDGES